MISIMIGRNRTMPKTKIWYIGFLIGAFVSQTVVAMSFDNRFLPLLQRPRLTVNGARSEFAGEIFVTTASKSFNELQQDIPLAEIFGKFDQAELAKGIAALGNPNPLPSEFQILSKIPWEVSGKRQAQGVTLRWDQSLGQWLSTGCSLYFMRVASRYLFKLDAINIEQHIALKPGDAVLLDDSRRSMLQQIGICNGISTQYGFGDIDWYLRVGNMWEYTLRFRRIDAGARLGVLFPTGLCRRENEPASIPFGGNGHWGVYGEIDAMFELKEDWKVGFLLRLNNRFSKTKEYRMPAAKEPEIFGAAVGLASVNPGVTAIFVPYFLFENLRDGLSLGLNYNLAWHQKDSWTNVSSCTVELKNVETRSKWSSEYFTVTALYDFGKMKVKRELNPIFTFYWDIPSSLFLSSRVNRTNRISIGLAFVY